MTLWDKVESALVGGLDNGIKKFVYELANYGHEYTMAEVTETAKELQEAINDANISVNR